MRAITFSNSNYLGVIRTSDNICPAYGNNYLEVEFRDNTTIASKVTVEIEGSSMSFTLPVTNNKVLFSLEWFRYYAPTHGVEPIELSVYADNTLISSIEYLLTAGRGEVLVSPLTFSNGIDTYIADERIVVGATQITPHWDEVEYFIKNTQDILVDQDYVADKILFRGAFRLSEEISAYGFFSKKANPNNLRVSFASSVTGSSLLVHERNIKSNLCCDIEIRITDRNGLRGVMGGKVVDSTEGGDDVKSIIDNLIPYRGICQHQKKGQKVQKEVFFDCDGDANLLSLLRDACVYGVAEWYDNVTEQWLPCEVADKSLDTDPFKEQSITFILQEL